MSKVIVYSRPDGGVSVCNPVWEEKREDEDEASFLARISAKDVPADATNVMICDRADLPVYDSATRNRWRMVNGLVSIAPIEPEPQNDAGGSSVVA